MSALSTNDTGIPLTGAPSVSLVTTAETVTDPPGAEGSGAVARVTFTIEDVRSA